MDKMYNFMLPLYKNIIHLVVGSKYHGDGGSKTLKGYCITDI